jgi:hypothetical protein
MVQMEVVGVGLDDISIAYQAVPFCMMGRF